MKLLIRTFSPCPGAGIQAMRAAGVVSRAVRGVLRLLAKYWHASSGPAPKKVCAANTARCGCVSKANCCATSPSKVRAPARRSPDPEGVHHANRRQASRAPGTDRRQRTQRRMRGAAARSVRALASELRSRGIEVIEAHSCEDGMATATLGRQHRLHPHQLDPGTRTTSKVHTEATELMRAVRKRNTKLPIFLMASRKMAGTVSVEVAQLSDEFIWILEDTASFVAGRVSSGHRSLSRAAAAAVRQGTGHLQPRARVFLGRARPPGWCRLPQVAGGPRCSSISTARTCSAPTWASSAARSVPC